jgi:hypothetical protein
MAFERKLALQITEKKLQKATRAFNCTAPSETQATHVKFCHFLAQC